MPPRSLPVANSLRDAVREVLRQPQGKPARRFIDLTQDGTAPDDVLVQVCTNLTLSDQAVEFVVTDIEDGAPFLLTIEDFIWRSSTWGFNQTTIDRARVNVAYYDFAAQLGHARYLY